MSDEHELRAMAAEIMSGRVSLRQMSMKSGGYDYADTLHNIYADYGYPAQVTFFNLWNMYRRFGVAGNVVKLPAETCWSSDPKVESTDASFTRDFDKLVESVRLWTRLQGLDKRQRVGRYAGLLMRVSDGKELKEPLDKNAIAGVDSLKSVVPLYEGQLEITQEGTDPSKDDFGEPTMLQYKSNGTGSRDDKNAAVVDVHPSRVVFAAEDADDGTVYGVPALEDIYNSLMDLRKIIGGGGEGFYKNSSQSIVFDLKDAASASANEEKLKSFNKEFDEFSRNRQRRSIWTPGMEANTLSSNLIEPAQFAQVALDDIAAGSGIPVTILIGKQTGRLASEEDSRHFLSTQQARREGFCSDMITSVIEWCIGAGVLPTAQYSIEWNDLLARSDAEKLSNAESMATVNERQYKSGGSSVFTSDEIRDAAGYEVEEDEPDDGGEELDTGTNQTEPVEPEQ